MGTQKVHFLGIGGSGASAVAAIAKAQGFEVSGCDKVISNEFTKVFDKDALFEGHSPDHLQDIDILAVTPAIYSLDPDNNELQEAKRLGIQIMSWQEFMGEYLEKDKFVIAVCGTHGKSTTTAMIGLLLEEAGLDPTVELGAVVPKWGTNYRVGKVNYSPERPKAFGSEAQDIRLRETQSRRARRGVKEYFVTEADEFNDNFLASNPDITIVTTIEMDHPEYFKDFEDYKKSFRKFFGQTKEKIIANLSDPGVKSVLASHTGCGNTIINYSEKLIDFPLQVPGQYNILNASAVYQVGLALGIDPEVIRKSLQSFSGIGRRFEYMGRYQGTEIYSDFGHHPTEIKVTLEAAREKFPDKKITVIFQPHMFSRTYALYNDFVKVFKELPVDKTYILDIYPSREVDTGLVTSKQLVETIDKENIIYISNNNEVLEKIKSEISGRGEEVIFFMGAGSTHELAKKLFGI